MNSLENFVYEASNFGYAIFYAISISSLWMHRLTKSCTLGLIWYEEMVEGPIIGMGGQVIETLNFKQHILNSLKETEKGVELVFKN